MLGTYAALALVLGASYLVGQALFCACGHRERSTLAPAAGLGVICAAAWLASDLASSAWAGLGAVLALTLVAATLLRFEPPTGMPDGAIAVAAGAIFLGSLPFLVELRFGILGTSLNPDMSQHLFATDRIANGGEERLIAEGYPLGPHALVAGLSKLGISFVHGFNGLTLATAVAAALAPLGLLRDLERPRRIGAALLVGVAYLAAAYFVQGAFKETMQALFVLAFAVGLAELVRGSAPTSRGGAKSGYELSAGSDPLRALPLAAIAVGSLYAYSFPGLAWIVGALGVFAVAEVVRLRSFAGIRAALVPGGIALVAVAVAAAPEVPRMLDFASFETFDPDGPGLGNLFNPISAIEALGIWPSGDFRVEPGDGFAPAFAFYVGGAVAALALALGLVRAIQSGETALASALAACAALYAYAVFGGTPYQEAKALAIAAPVVMLIAVRGVLEETPRVHALRNVPARMLVVPALAFAFLVGAAGSSALALLNGPVGPSAWTPALLEFSAQVPPEDPILAVVDDDLASANGVDLVTWELRGHEVCVLAANDVSPSRVSDRAFEAVVVIGELEQPLPAVGRLSEIGREEAGGLDYVLYRARLTGGEPDCPFVADGDRAEPVS